MAFEIYFRNKNYSYDLGPSQQAHNACRGLAIYKANPCYGNVRRLMADLAEIVVQRATPYSLHACYATQLLALSIFPTLNDYQRLFAARAVVEAYEIADYVAPADWQKISQQYQDHIANNFDVQAFLAAGMVYVDARTGNPIHEPIPTYVLRP